MVLWLVVVEWLARLILVVLIGLSIWSVKIMIEKRRYLKSLNLPFAKLKTAIKKNNLKDLTQDKTDSHHFLSTFFEDATPFKSSQKVEKIFDSFVAEQRRDLEKGLPILGTLGSTTPFVGLLGTILGIIVSFGELSQGAGNTNSVMFSLAEALILTAVGLIVAIPAVVAYNYFGRQVKLLLSQAEILKDDFIAYTLNESRSDDGK